MKRPLPLPSLLLLTITLWLMLLAACQPPPPPDLPPAEIVSRSAAAMSALPGFHFIIDRSGAPAYVDPDNTISFRRATGDYVAPDRAQASVRVILPGLVTDLQVISIAAIQWETNPLTGEWMELPPDWGFNPSVLFREDVGLQAVLSTDLTDMTLIGSERLEDGPDTPLYHVTGTVAGERLYTMSGFLIGPDAVTVSLWIDPESFYLHRVAVTEPVAGSPEPSLWQIDFQNFAQVVSIEPPVLPSP